MIGIAFRPGGHEVPRDRIEREHMRARRHGLHAAAAAARHIHAGLIDEPLRDDGVNARHQIVVVGSGVVVIDAVREIAAVSGAAARIRVQHDEVVRREILKHVVERDAVHRERAAVNLEDERVLLRRVE